MRSLRIHAGAPPFDRAADHAILSTFAASPPDAHPGAPATRSARPAQVPEGLRRCDLKTELSGRFREVAPAVEFISLRYVKERSELLHVRQDVPQPVSFREDVGAMITVIDKGGIGYGATSDLSLAGLRRAAESAVAWARRSAGRAVADFSKIPPQLPDGHYETPVKIPWVSVPIDQKLDLLRVECRRLKTDDRIVDWQSGIMNVETETLFLTPDGENYAYTFSSALGTLYLVEGLR
jgi:predicted Zn-dependent protease